MKAKYFLLAIIPLLFFAACEKPKSLLEAAITVKYVDKNGNDMLDPANPNGIKESDIDIYYMINGVKTRYYDSRLDHPEQFSIEKKENGNYYYMSLGVNPHYDSHKKSVTFIDLGKQVDTVISTFRVFESGYVLEDVTYNGKAYTFEKNTPFTVTLK